MNKLIVFNHISLDGFFVDSEGSMRWARAHNDDEEWNAFVAENSQGDGTLVFGRVTYDLMASYWPTPMADQHSPTVAKRMNAMQKIVFSRNLDHVSWQNTQLIKGDLVSEIKKLKGQPGEGMVILGSGSIVSQLANENLIDEYQFVVNAIILGAGRTMFDGVSKNLQLKLAQQRAFRNGNVFVCYKPAV